MLVVIATSLFVACDTEVAQGPKIVVSSPTEITLGMYEGDTTIEYEIVGITDVQAEVTLSASWLRIKRHESGTLVVQYEGNETGGTRMAAVTLSYGSSRATVVINQSGVPEAATIELVNDGDITIDRCGQCVAIDYTLTNRNPDDYVFVKTTADWIYSIDTNTDGTVKLGVATNISGQERSTLLTVGYGSASVTTTLIQAGDGEIVFNAPTLTGEYLGDAATPCVANYWFFLTDRGFNSEGASMANATYYRIDAYGPVNATGDEMVKIPNGTYTFDPNNTLNEWTFTAEYSGFWVTNSDARRDHINPFESGTIVVEGTKITLEVVVNGEHHTVIYEGETKIPDASASVVIYSTLSGDYHADLSDHYMLFECYGDYYDYGYYNWMFVIAPNDGSGDCFQFDIISGYNDYESGFAGNYEASDFLAPNSFIPGWTQGVQLLCSWYFTADQEDVAPFRDGEMSVTDNGDGTVTVTIDVYDDRRNNITAEWTGVPEEVVSNISSVVVR